MNDDTVQVTAAFSRMSRAADAYAAEMLKMAEAARKLRGDFWDYPSPYVIQEEP